MTPREATSERKLLTLQEDNFPPSPDVWSILVSEDHVSLHSPGNEAPSFVSIPRDQFNAIVDWYGRDQKNR